MEARALSVDECVALATDPRCVARCPDDTPNAGCNEDRSLDCASLAGKPGGRIAVHVNCTADGLKMPPGGTMLASDRLAFLRWVVAGGDAGSAPAPIEPPVLDGAGVPYPSGFFTNNGVGDGVHWKSPFQLTYGMGSALFRTSSGATVGHDPWARPIPPVTRLPPLAQTGYPTQEIAAVAGHYIDDSQSGDRGLSLLGVLDWEKRHSTAGEPCRFGGTADALDALVSPGAEVQDIVRAVKQRFMGENQLTETERGLIETVVGTPLDTVVDPGNAAAINSGVRRICNVFMKSPLFMLSYVADPSATMSGAMRVSASSRSQATATRAGTESEMLLPRLCAGRLDCRHVFDELETALRECFKRPVTCRRPPVGALTANVLARLAELRLPVDRPELDLERALAELPAAVPSANDPRLQSGLLILPLAAGTVTEVRGRVMGYYDGREQRIRRGEDIAYGTVLEIGAGARLTVDVGGHEYSTGRTGMEWPPWERLRRGELTWLVLVNGPESASAPAGGIDPRISLGQPHGSPAPVVRTPEGQRPIWARFGEGGHWYTRP